METIGISLLIGGPIVGFLFLLVGIIQLFNKDNKENTRGKKTVLIGFIIIVVSALIGFSICTGIA